MLGLHACKMRKRIDVMEISNLQPRELGWRFANMRRCDGFRSLGNDAAESAGDFWFRSEVSGCAFPSSNRSPILGQIIKQKSQIGLAVRKILT
jgi:hypothetical protein